MQVLCQNTNKLNLKVNEICDDRKNFEPIYNSIEKLNRRKVKLYKIPYWYLRIGAKYILLRNIKLSNLIKTIFQFNIVFSIIKNSNFLIKFFIIIESIVNAFWYSFILTFKSKK